MLKAEPGKYTFRGDTQFLPTIQLCPKFLRDYADLCGLDHC